MVSTGRHHGFESVAEQRVLLALDFAGNVTEVLAQPFRLRFSTSVGWREHVPDFLAVTGTGRWLIDVRPADRIKPEDQVAFAASAQAAFVAGWRYTVVSGWRAHVLTTLDTLSAQRRPLADHWGLQKAILAAVAGEPRPFVELVADTVAPTVTRCHVLHLLWYRRLGIDLAHPLADHTLVWRAEPATAGRRR